MQTKNALSNLKNRYISVLKKCNLLNTFGSLAITSMLVVGAVSMASANNVNISGTGVDSPVSLSAGGGSPAAGDTVTTTSSSSGTFNLNIDGRTLSLGTMTIGNKELGGDLTVTLKQGSGAITEITSSTLNVVADQDETHTTIYNISDGLTHTVNNRVSIQANTGVARLEVATGGTLVLNTSAGGSAGTILRGSGDIADAQVYVSGTLQATDGTNNTNLNVKEVTLTLDNATVNASSLVLDAAATLTLEGSNTINGDFNPGDDIITIEAGESLLVRGDLTISSDADIKGANADMIITGDTTFTNATLRASGSSGNDIIFASAAFLHNLPNGINGNLITELGSYLVLGGDSTNNGRAYAESAFAESNHSWGADVSAALFIVKPQTLDSSGSIHIDGANANINAAPVNSAIFADNSLLVVDASGIGSSAALASTNGKLTVSSDAKLHITGAPTGSTLNIVSGFRDGTSNIAAGGWGNLTTSSSLQVTNVLGWNPATGTYSVEFAALSTAGGVDMLLQTYSALTPELAKLMVYFSQTSPDVNSPITHHKLFSRIFDDRYIGTKDPFLAAKTLTSIFNIGASSGSVQNAFATTKAGVNTLLSRLGLASADFGDNVQIAYSDNSQENLGISAGSDMANAMPNGFAAWLMPLYNHTHASGFESGVFQSGYTSDLGGISLGADYTFQNKYRLGLAINAGGGSSNSNGDFNETSNNFSFMGLSLYGSAHWDNFALIADMGYTHVDNEISQDLPSVLAMNNVEADITNEIFTIGLTGEYTFNLRDIEVTPHMGIRYTHAATNAYDASIDGATIVHTKSDAQDIFAIPIGVTVAKDFITQTGYVITPKADVGIIASFGELESTSISSIPNVAGSARLSMDTVDNLAFSGGLGLEVAKENFSLDLNYTLQASEHETSHGVFANLRYKF